MKTYDVIIAGLGPTGLLLSRLLQNFGVNFISFDKRECISKSTRAINLTPYSMNILSEVLKNDNIITKARAINDSIVYYKSKKISKINYNEMKFEYKNFYFLPQPEVEIELYNSIENKSEHIFECHEIKSIQKYDSEYIVTVQNENHTFDVKSKYIVGADGGKSFVRNYANILTQEENYDSYFILYDISCEHNLNTVIYHIYDEGYLILCPFTQNKMRVIYSSKNIKSFNLESLNHIFELQKILAIENYYFNSIEIQWFANSQFKHLTTEKAIKNNIILAGDALHLFSPIAGMNMNMGLQDAMSLGWRLADSIKIKSSIDLLNDYEKERLLAVQKVKNTTKYLTELVTHCSQHKESLSFLYKNKNFNHIKQIIPKMISGYLDLDNGIGETHA